MIQIRRSDERGSADHGWLQSRHTFSFASYYDPRHMGVSALRVINDDKVMPGRGFDTHSHRDMEIISYVKKGAIEHKDSMGNIKQLPAGKFQLMSAGTGITHSEYNPSQTELLEFLQIWIQPNQFGIKPGYQQKQFDPKPGMQLIVSPDGREDSLLVHQNAFVYQLFLPKHPSEKPSAQHKIKTGRTVYVHLVAGELQINGEPLTAGDGATIKAIETLEFVAQGKCHALIFDLP